MTDAARGASVSRRALLGGAAGLAASAAVPTAGGAEGLRVMTRNLYVGVDLFEVADASDLDEVRAVAGELLADAESHPYAARMAAIAAEIASAAPDVVGLQEAAMVRTREPSAFDGEHDPGAQDVLVDLLALLTDALRDRGVAYEVAAAPVINDIEVPARVDDGEVDIRLTDRLAVLVREDRAVEDVRSARFDAAVPVPIEDTDLEIQRGFCSLDLSVDDARLTVATTHLESTAVETRREQAEELLGRLPTDRSVVLVGDINSGPRGVSETYDRLRESFADAHETLRPDADGATCCQDGDLRNDRSLLSRRVDVVLYRGDIEPTTIERVGADPDDRVSASIADETVRLWPSDHAGVVADLTPGGAPATPMEEAAQTPTGGPDDPPEYQYGLGLLAALVAAGLAFLVRLLSRERHG